MDLSNKKLQDLREVAKAIGIKNITKYKKGRADCGYFGDAKSLPFS